MSGLNFTLSTTPSSDEPTGEGVQHERVLIMGSGPAGLTAAIYAARANLKPLVIAGHELGGQIALTHEIENYPGFPEPLGGQDLVDQMVAQAERFGARIKTFTAVSKVDFGNGSPFHIWADDGSEYLADTVVVTVGATPRHLNVPGEAQFTGNGVSYCATCDGYFFRDKEVVVVGGGDSALEEALFLTRFASKIEIIHRRDQLRAGAALAQRAQESGKIDFIWDTVVEEILGEQSVNAVRLRNVKTGEVWEKPTDGVFIFIGHEPNTDLFEGQLERDNFGYVITDHEMRTSVDGVFAAGEAQDRIFRQVATSVGQGAAAGIMVERWLAGHGE